MGIRPLVVVANIIKDDKGRMLIGKHKDGHKEDMYAFPGGKVEDETIEQAFWRELKEECGLKKPDFDIKLNYLGNSELKFKEKRFLVMFYICPYYQEKMGQPKTMEPTKHYSWEWKTLDEIKKLPISDSMKDFVRLYEYKY